MWEDGGTAHDDMIEILISLALLLFFFLLALNLGFDLVFFF